MSRQIIEEVCKELNIKYTNLSKNWITKLEYKNNIRYLSYNKFDLNGYVIGKIMDDKYAMYDILKNLHIPVTEHNIFYREGNTSSFAEGCNTKASILNCFKKYNSDVVIKPNLGYQGKGVYHITNEKDLLEVTEDLFKHNYSISICPFYKIKNEYRVIILDSIVKLIYKKINPMVVGDGMSTLKELLMRFNEHYFQDKDIPDTILKNGEAYTYDFRFNLSKGAIASTDIETKLKDKIITLAIDVTKKVGIRFASVDIIETEDNKILVLELNSGVTINKATNFIPNGYNIAKEIYKEAILKLFE